MKSSDLPVLASAFARTARLGLREYLVEYPPGVLLAAVLPRTILQVLFLTALGRAVGGPAGASAAGVGASAFAMVTATVNKAPDVLINEQVQGTLYRLRMTALPLPGLVAARWAVYAAEALTAVLVAAPVAALVAGDGRMLRTLPAALPLYTLMVLSSSAFGFTIAVLAMNGRADVFLTNLATYLVLALSGVLSPVPGGGMRAVVGAALPLSHGIAALRALNSGHGPVLATASGEALVGALWCVLAMVGLRFQDRRSRRTGRDFLL
ncbi:ABC transporter permease [Streptomyces sp. tea 10]|nr:ABC transporter permease [Streptomyces sp. tea 10]